MNEVKTAPELGRFFFASIDTIRLRCCRLCCRFEADNSRPSQSQLRQITRSVKRFTEFLPDFRMRWGRLESVWSRFCSVRVKYRLTERDRKGSQRIAVARAALTSYANGPGAEAFAVSGWSPSALAASPQTDPAGVKPRAMYAAASSALPSNSSVGVRPACLSRFKPPRKTWTLAN
jgi:hypothetical protein